MSRQVGQLDWTPADVERGIAAWLKLGTAAAAARETGIPETTIRYWRTRHPERFAEHCRRLAQELRDLREETSRETAEAVREAVLVARRALRGDAPIGGRDAAALLKALATVGSSLDRIARLDASTPTEIVEDRRTDADLVADIEQALANPALRAVMEREFAERET